MKVKSADIKQLNITAVFKSIQHNLVPTEEFRQLFKLRPEEEKTSPYIELPDVKALMLSTRRKSVLIEQNRLRVNDDSGGVPKNSDIVDYFDKAMGLLDKFQLTAYGFNYTILLNLAEEAPRDFVAKRLLKITKGEVIGAGVRINYEAESVRYELRIDPTENPLQLVLHLNVHYTKDELPKDLQKQLEKNYRETQRIIKELKD